MSVSTYCTQTEYVSLEKPLAKAMNGQTIRQEKRDWGGGGGFDITELKNNPAGSLAADCFE